jgi:hypothetical protein
VVAAAAVGGWQVRKWRFGGRVAKGVTISDDGMAATRAKGAEYEYQGALVEEAVDTGGRAYAEWVIEEAVGDCYIMLGVTALEAAPQAGTCMHNSIADSPESRMYGCRNSRAYPGYRDWGGSGLRRKGDRVGLLVDKGRLWVVVNGARLGPGPMASDLPARVRFAVEMCNAGSSVRLVAGAAPPADV